jgi:hypothetical protein
METSTPRTSKPHISDDPVEWTKWFLRHNATHLLAYTQTLYMLKEGDGNYESPWLNYVQEEAGTSYDNYE